MATVPPAALPYLSLGLGIQQLGQSQRYADLAASGLSPEQRAAARASGTSNIGANLAQRGLLDSSLYSGSLAELEKQIAQAQNPAAGIQYGLAQGYGQGGAQTLGNLFQLWQLQQMFGGGGMPPMTPRSQYDPWAGPSYNAPPYPGLG